MSSVKFKSGDKVYHLPDNSESIDDIVKMEVGNAHYNPDTLIQPLITMKDSLRIYYERELHKTKEEAIKEIIRRKESTLIDLSAEIKELYSLVRHSPPKPHYEYSVDSLQKFKDQMVQNPTNSSEHEVRPNGKLKIKAGNIILFRSPKDGKRLIGEVINIDLNGLITCCLLTRLETYRDSKIYADDVLHIYPGATRKNISDFEKWLHHNHEMRPNEETINAITAAERGDVKTFKTFDKFMADLNDEEISVKIILQRLNSLKKRVEEIEEKLMGDDD